MKIDIERIQRYFAEIKARHHEIEELLLRNTDPEILREPWAWKNSWRSAFISRVGFQI